MASPTLTIEQVLRQLAETPPRLAALTAALSPASLRARPAAGAWSVNDVLAHLRACADVWGDAIRTILAEDRPTLRAVNPRTWITQTTYPDLAFAPSLAAFTTQREALLALLGALPSDAWARAATVRGAGAPREQSVHAYALRLARHEQAHLTQVTRIVTELTGEHRPEDVGGPAR